AILLVRASSVLAAQRHSQNTGCYGSANRGGAAERIRAAAGAHRIAACAGYSRSGDEYDNAVGQAIMNVLRAVAQEMKCFVLGIDHFGKTLEAGTRGASAKESSADVVLACLGDKQLSGLVTNTRLAIRKHRGGTQGQEYPYTLRLVEAPEKDED